MAIFIRTQNHNALPHALLLSGSAGMGKLLFAQAFAELLLCKNAKMKHVVIVPLVV
jgi:DNA polymerase III delta prime subunit